jgi:transposase
MKTAATRKGKTITVKEQVLYVALELGKAKWKVGSTIGMGQKPREVTIRGGDREGLRQEIGRAKQRFGLSQSVQVVSCYEAGPDGFWLHRFLLHIGVNNHVVDSSSIEVNRRARRAKTDRLDVRKLLAMLLRYRWGEKKVWSVVHAPSVEEEDRRQLHRELMSLKTERTRQINRIKGLLTSQGILLASCGKGFLARLKDIRLWDGSPLGKGIVEHLTHEYDRLEIIRLQIKKLLAEREERVRSSKEQSIQKVKKLMTLRGVGLDSAWLYTMELFGWRKIKNRRELAALSGLVPTPYQSGESSREQGISKHGVRYVRAYAVELAWNWLRLQPNSDLSLWYTKRFAYGGRRMRKIGIVALARKLLIALWRYVEMDLVPQAAQLKAVA